MPSINVAMERSLREGFLNLLTASLRPALEGRGVIQNSVNDVTASFSSWDNCMNAVYCKYPVIALIAIGGLIIISVVWCIARCACCGLSCCCECCYCLKCCGNCCGCCDPPKGTPHKHLDEPYHNAAPSQQYRSHEPMSAATAAIGPQPAKSYSEPPQYAEFDVSKKGGAAVNGDALPAMPSWDSAETKKVMVEEEVELEQLKKPEATAQNATLVAGATTSPASTSPLSPTHNISPDQRSPYGAQGPREPTIPNLAGGPIGAASSDPYAINALSYNNHNNNAPYRQQSSTSLDQGSRHTGMAVGQGRRTPMSANNRGYGQGNGGYPGARSRQASRDDYGMNGDQQGQGYGGERGYGNGQDYGMGMGPGRRSPPRGPNANAVGVPSGERYRGSPAPQGDYGYGVAPRRSPGPMEGYAYGEAARRSPAPQADSGYGSGYNSNNRPYGQPQRQHSSDSMRPLVRSPPQRHYSTSNGALAPASPTAVQNSGGFDFTSGYSRPQQTQHQQREYDDQYESTDRRVPPSRQNTGGYPGYKPYAPANGNPPAQLTWSGV